tara:strand:+ start:1957 stop:2229 length:273 start_codon:yes stop_codon:yes gene_type:complete
VQVKTLIALFLGLAFLDHAVVFTISLAFKDLFERWMMKDKTNPLRWLEYSASASIMSVLVGALSGIYDVHTLFLIGVTTAICMVCEIDFA